MYEGEQKTGGRSRSERCRCRDFGSLFKEAPNSKRAMTTKTLFHSPAFSCAISLDGRPSMASFAAAFSARRLVAVRPQGRFSVSTNEQQAGVSVFLLA